MKHYRKLWRGLPLLRALGVLSAVGIITSLVTFSALQSTGSALKGNTIQTATASLLISTQNAPASFAAFTPGFTFTGLVPGGVPQPIANNDTVYLENTGTGTLKLAVAVPDPGPSGLDGVDLSQVFIVLTPATGSGQASQSIALSDLRKGPIALTTASATLLPTQTTSFHVQVSMGANALTSGVGATISGLDLSFSGTVVQ